MRCVGLEIPRMNSTVRVMRSRQMSCPHSRALIMQSAAITRIRSPIVPTIARIPPTQNCEKVTFDHSKCTQEDTVYHRAVSQTSVEPSFQDSGCCEGSLEQREQASTFLVDTIISFSMSEGSVCSPTAISMEELIDLV